MLSKHLRSSSLQKLHQGKMVPKRHLRNFSLHHKQQQQKFDLGLYVVTDADISEQQGGRSLEETVKQAILGGCSMIQYREKRYPQQLTTRQMLDQASRLQNICRQHGVPFLIDDRIDLALAIDADGVHVGQKDLPPHHVRKLIGPSKILGLTVGTEQQVDEALSPNVRADYLGTNAIFPTSTKKDAGESVGLDGLKKLVQYVRRVTVDRGQEHVGVVAIGGIGLTNVKEVMECGVDGVAVVSSVVGAPSALTASQQLRKVVNVFQNGDGVLKAEVREAMVQNLLNLKQLRPLVHNITNNVVTTQSANALLAIGASPVMSQYHEEMEDMVNIASSLLINIGTLDTYGIQAMHLAAKRANQLKKPIILDPVGFGATQAREKAVLDLLTSHKITILKGNAGEIAKMYDKAGQHAQVRGVDAEGSIESAVGDMIVKDLANRYGCVVCMTGPMDIISDGTRIIHIHHNEPNLQHLTGVGCMTGSIQAALCASTNDPLIAAATGCAFVAMSGEMASKRLGVKNGQPLPLGSFREKLFDAFSTISPTHLRQYLNFDCK